MQSCEHDHYKQDGQKRGQRGLFGAAAVLIFLSVVGAFWRRKPRRRGVLSVRSALILTLSTIAALGGGWLLYLGHSIVAQIVFSAVGVFALAVVFFDRVISDF